jgi:hypothetical protein
MSSATDYLRDRFVSDARVLRDRADALGRGTRIPGPDASTSRAMAVACDTVTAMLDGIAHQASAQDTLDALGALIPLLEQRAAKEKSPAVRSVFVGAATRIREVRNAEAKASATALEAEAIDDDDAFGDDVDDNDVDDDDVDDGDVDNDTVSGDDGARA